MYALRIGRRLVKDSEKLWSDKPDGAYVKSNWHLSSTKASAALFMDVEGAVQFAQEFKSTVSHLPPADCPPIFVVLVATRPIIDRTLDIICTF